MRIDFRSFYFKKEMMKTPYLIFALLFSLNLIGKPPRFEMQTIDDEVRIVYGVQLADMNADGKVDVLLVDKDKVAWYENPSWKKRIIVDHLTRRDHVCLTARDLNGDGRAELALGGEWNPADTINSGAVFYLFPKSRLGEGFLNFLINYSFVFYTLDVQAISNILIN